MLIFTDELDNKKAKLYNKLQEDFPECTIHPAEGLNPDADLRFIGIIIDRKSYLRAYRWDSYYQINDPSEGIEYDVLL